MTMLTAGIIVAVLYVLIRASARYDLWTAVRHPMMAAALRRSNRLQRARIEGASSRELFTHYRRLRAMCRNHVENHNFALILMLAAFDTGYTVYRENNVDLAIELLEDPLIPRLHLFPEYADRRLTLSLLMAVIAQHRVPGRASDVLARTQATMALRRRKISNRLRQGERELSDAIGAARARARRTLADVRGQSSAEVVSGLTKLFKGRWFDAMTMAALETATRRAIASGDAALLGAITSALTRNSERLKRHPESAERANEVLGPPEIVSDDVIEKTLDVLDLIGREADKAQLRQRAAQDTQKILRSFPALSWRRDPATTRTDDP